MNDSLRPAVLDALDYVLALQREDVRPDAARDRLQDLRGRHPELAVDLLSEVEVFDDSVHYDVLLRPDGLGTVSLSYCPDRAVPWPLRGVHRWSEADLVRVNAKVLAVHQAVALIDFIWDEAPIIDRLVNACLMKEELERAPIKLTDAELQDEMNKFRAAKKLFKAEDTLRWLQRHGMSHEKLEGFVADHAVVARLRERVAGDRVEEYFRDHGRDFDAVQVARLEVADEGRARELAEDIRAGRLDFFAAAERCYFESAERGQPPTAGLFAVIERRQVSPAIGEQLFAASPGELVGPAPAEKGFVLLRVVGIRRAELDDRTRATIQTVLFDDWLAERRKAANIEWCWGNVTKTG